MTDADRAARDFKWAIQGGMKMTNADFAVKGFAFALQRFMEAYDCRYWESFGNSYKEVVKCASKQKKEALRDELLKLQASAMEMLAALEKA